MRRPLLLLSALVLFCACGPHVRAGGATSASDDDASSLLAPLVGAPDDAGADEPPGDDEASDAGPPDFEDAPTENLPDEGTPLPPPFDAGPGGTCDSGAGPGDLVIDELMIESVAGTGDDGEWIEVTSTRACALDLRGVRGECPVGSKVHSFEVADDVWVAAGGTFVIADSTDPAVNHDLPGTLVPWAGQPGDVLRNEGGTVTLYSGETMIDSLTWPKVTLVPGTSLAFPADCDPTQRTDFSVWQPSTASWFPGFYGTPNAPNDDVACQ